ncbi:MAG TPA: hypothetical protein DDX03_07500 [Firmicutes bacterium]|nr:hypothetical protein [Bacillota bacterium]
MAEQKSPQTVQRWASLERAYQSQKFISLLLAICLLVSLGLNVMLAAKEQVIVGIDTAGNKETLTPIAGTSGEEQFVKTVIETLYNWDPVNYESAYKNAASMMTSSLGSKLLGTLDDTTRAGIEGDSMACAVVIESIEKSNADVWIVTGIKTLRGRTVNKRTRVEFTVSLAKVAVTNNNPWGLSIAGLGEKEVTQ